MSNFDWISHVWNEKHPSPTHDIMCRHCQACNRVLVSRAATEPEKYMCAKCKKPLFLEKDEVMSNISPRAFGHILDASTLRSLQAIPGATRLLKVLHKQLTERAFRYAMMASAIHCNENQFPELVEIVERANKRLGGRINPTIFISSMPETNAFTSGGDGALLYFTTAILNHMSDEELLFVTGHELGHILSDHLVARFLMHLLMSGGISCLPDFAKYVSYPLQMSLQKWAHCSELTADRAGLLACRDVTAALSTMLKLACGNDAGVNERTTISLASFVKQARELKDQEAESMMDSFIAFYYLQTQSHPLIAWRVLELIDWVENGNYLDILAGAYI